MKCTFPDCNQNLSFEYCSDHAKQKSTPFCRYASCFIPTEYIFCMAHNEAFKEVKSRRRIALLVLASSSTGIKKFKLTLKIEIVRRIYERHYFCITDKDDILDFLFSFLKPNEIKDIMNKMKKTNGLLFNFYENYFNDVKLLAESRCFSCNI
uniref:Uncharacterized protein n=1 Tax=Cacopsylla melanoneura TaxID=428564 RepID=A0A8D8VKC1_9HEMI